MESRVDSIWRRVKPSLRGVGGVFYLSLGLFFGLGLGCAHANSASLDLQVTFAGTLSVSIDGVADSTRTFAAAAGAYVVPSSATVTNDSGGLVSRWQLSVSTLPQDDGNWQLAQSTGGAADIGSAQCATAAQCPGPNQYAVQALFISSATAATCPAPAAADWWASTATVVTSTATFYDATHFAGTTMVNGSNGLPDNPQIMSIGNVGDMLPNTGQADGSGKRGMCVRVTMPSASTTPNPQVIRVMITATPG